MARRCTTVPGFGTCCRASQQGLTPTGGATGAGRAFTMTTHTGTTRCARCDVVASTSHKHPGRPVFKFQWVSGSAPSPVGCGLGPGGCPSLSAGGGQQGNILQIQ